MALDCGIRMNAENTLPDFSLLKDFGGVDCVIVSHAHTDHSGALPILSREYPNAPLYMTHPTKDLIRVLLYDSLKIMDRRESEIPVFAPVHVEHMLDNIVCYSPNRTFKPFADSDIAVTLYLAGHVDGAAGVFIAGNEGALFYSGDFSASPQRTVGAASFPKLRPDVAILESTYGDRLHASRDLEEERLIETIREVTLRKGKLLIPAFSLGRAQEIILVVNRALAKKQLPEDLRVYVDGMVNDMCQIFSRYPNYLRAQYGKKILRGAEIFYNEHIISVKRSQELRDRIIADENGLVIISSSGMLTGGPSQWYAEKLAGAERNYIALTGYQDEESPGRQLLNLAGETEKTLKIEGRTVPVACEIGLYSLSAHADKMEIINLAHSLGAKRVMLNHGDGQVIESLAAELQREYPGHVYVPKNGELFDFTIRGKRAQRAAEKIAVMEQPPEGIEGLWSFLLERYGVLKAFTIEDLADAHGGAPDEQAFREAVNSSGYFETEVKRPFMYHCAAPENIRQTEASSAMEVNEALRLAEEMFPPETGLYKKGARFADKIVLLYFDFPLVQAKAMADRIDEYEQLTGWKTEINADCRLSAAESLISELLAGSGGIMTKSVSYFREDKAFLATLAALVANMDGIARAFFEKTGLALRISDGTQNKAPAAVKIPGRMEQNQALEYIDRYFSAKPHRPYKKSLKVRNGETGIELSFLTSALGERYLSDLDYISSHTYWNVWVSPLANQHELLKTAAECLFSRGVAYKKLSFLPESQNVQVTAGAKPDEETEKSVSDEFLERTGVALIFR